MLEFREKLLKTCHTSFESISTCGIFGHDGMPIKL